MTIAKLRNSLLVEGSTYEVPWDKEKRLMLVNKLHWVGINEIFIDGYFDADVRTFPDLIRELNAIDPYKVWNWKDRIYDGNSAKYQLGMWHRYRVELYPNTRQGCGICDEYGHEKTFPAVFRKTRDSFLPKGIIKIIK